MKQIEITSANASDMPQILELQYLAYQSEAELYGENIPPLQQTIDELKCEFNQQTFLKATTETGEIIGSVRAKVVDNVAYIGKLIVHPDFRRRGIGKRLMIEIEQLCNTAQCKLFTGNKSVGNIRLYEQLGYEKTSEREAGDGLILLDMVKHL